MAPGGGAFGDSTFGDDGSSSDISGSVAVSISHPTLSATGTNTDPASETGTAAISISHPALSASGTFYNATVDFEIHHPILAAVGTRSNPPLVHVPLRFGLGSDGTTADYHFAGRMAHVAIFDTALGADRIAFRYAQRLAALTGTLRPVRIFGGEIQTPTESGLGGYGVTPITTRISAIDFNQLIDRRYVSTTIPAGTLKAALQAIEPYLTPYGVVLDPDQVDGPSLPELVYTYSKLADVLGQFSTLSGYVFEVDYDKILRMFSPGSLAAPFNIAAGDGNIQGDVTVETSRITAGQNYANRVIVKAGTPEVPIIAEANDLVEQATARGLWETVITASTVFDMPTAQALADSYLVQSTPRPKTVKYLTYQAGLKCGQTQTINLPLRNLNNDFMITAIAVKPVGNLISYLVTLVEGSVFQGDWRKLYQAWSGSTNSATIVPSGTSGYGRVVYYLGGSQVEYVRGVGWISASAVQIIVDTVSRGSSSATVVARLRATSGSVTARLRNVSDGVTVGTSAVITNTDWQTVTFTVALTAGSKIYELQLLASVDNTDVAAVAYME